MFLSSFLASEQWKCCFLHYRKLGWIGTRGWIGTPTKKVLQISIFPNLKIMWTVYEQNCSYDFKFWKIENWTFLVGVPVHPTIPIHPDLRYVFCNMSNVFSINGGDLEIWWNNLLLSILPTPKGIAYLNANPISSSFLAGDAAGATIEPSALRLSSSSENSR